MPDQHTPGPWAYQYCKATQDGTPVFTLRSFYKSPACIHEGVWLADIRMGRHDEEVSPGEGCANARLIAAAPDLLAALKSARSTLVNLITANIDIPDFDPAKHVTVKLIDAAIAKAEGL